MDPFIQTKGQTYWLAVQLAGGLVGWKTSPNHWNEQAYFWNGAQGWTPRGDPRPGYDNMALDMAFVIVPEPATLGVLTLGLIPVLLRRRRLG